MKIFCGIIIVLISMFIGYELSQKYVKRKKFYQEFNSFNQRLTSEISFSHNTIKKLVDEYSQKKDDFSKNLVAFFVDKQENIKTNILNDDEKKDFKSYLKNIGTSDEKSQLKLLEIYKEKLNKTQEQAIIEEKKYKTFYVKLGFLFGLIMFIIII